MLEVRLVEGFQQVFTSLIFFTIFLIYQVVGTVLGSFAFLAILLGSSFLLSSLLFSFFIILGGISILLLLVFLFLLQAGPFLFKFKNIVQDVVLFLRAILLSTKQFIHCFGGSSGFLFSWLLLVVVNDDQRAVCLTLVS